MSDSAVNSGNGSPFNGQIADDTDDLLPEYSLDFSKARPNRFAFAARVVKDLNSVFELAIPFLDEHEAGVPRATQALWRRPMLSHDGATPMQEGAAASDAFVGAGVLSLADGCELPCEALLIPEQYGAWLNLCIPERELVSCYGPVGRPAMVDALGVLEQHLIQIAEGVFREAPFSMALIGWNVSGEMDEHRLRREDLERSRASGYLLSPDLHAQLGKPAGGTVLPSGLLWFSPNAVAASPSPAN